jgi:hypothetical protein
MSQDKVTLIAECKRIEHFSLWNATTHFTAATIAAYTHYLLVAIPIVLGAIGGWKYFSDPATTTPKRFLVASLCSLGAGVFSGLSSVWSLTRLRMDHFSAGTKYKTLENQARRAYGLHATDDDYEQFKNRVLELGKQYDELGETCVQSFDVAFWIAGLRIGKKTYKP